MYIFICLDLIMTPKYAEVVLKLFGQLDRLFLYTTADIEKLFHKQLMLRSKEMPVLSCCRTYASSGRSVL